VYDEIGRFNNDTGVDNCEQCPVGAYMSGLGATICTSCAPGSKSGSLGAVQCEYLHSYLLRFCINPSIRDQWLTIIQIDWMKIMK
jgi:hypothetical protein